MAAGYDKNGCPNENPKTAQAALNAVNRAKQDATKADADAKRAEKTANASQGMADDVRHGSEDPTLSEEARATYRGYQATLDRTAAQDREAADTAARKAKALKQTAGRAIAKCRQFRSAKDSKITQRCK